ncbi:hypothetical protein [Rufibacter aurantiacus]|uniref:hypothetical protein n=1 Tax=Rufibacter aurantiacus TaxID=2817374 RepID=UPI001B31418E|nr:hypothetical protein [Rufibacter aurantiacus]
MKSSPKQAETLGNLVRPKDIFYTNLTGFSGNGWEFGFKPIFRERSLKQQYRLQSRDSANELIGRIPNDF